MSDANKALVQRFYDQLNMRQIDVFDELFAPDIEDFSPHGHRRGREEHRKYAITSFTAFPDLRFHVEDLIAEGDKVVVRGRLTGNQSGPMINLPPNNRSLDITFIVIYQVQGGKIVRRWMNSDDLGFMKQMGVIADGT